MAINLSARTRFLSINGIDRTSNLVSLNLTQNELDDGGVFVTGQIELQCDYSEVQNFTYLASPAIGENWARGASVIYRVANQAGMLTNFLLSGGALYILKEPAPPDSNFRLRLDIGDQAALLNYRTADTDPSNITAGVSTARNTVIERYLAAAGASYSIGSIPYSFAFPQPKTEGNSLIEVAAQMARSANHILYTRPDGVITNKAISLTASPIATFRIGESEQLFEQVDGSGIETPVDQLVIAGISTSVNTDLYPRVKQQVTRAVYRFYSRDLNGDFTLKTYPYIQSRTTITDYGWDGSQERVTTFLESSIIVGGTINIATANESTYLNPLEETEQIKRYDDRDRLIYERTTVNQYINLSADSSVTNLSGFGVRQTVFPRQTRIPKSYEEIFYTYNDLDVLTSKRVESNNFAPNDFGFTTLSTQNDGYFQRTAKTETWSDGLYTIENQYKPRTFTFETGGAFNPTAAGQFLEGDWETIDSDSTYSTDGSTQPPATTYRKPYEPIETQVTATLTAQPFAGQSFYSRSRPVDVPYLESQLQATDYGNIYLALLYGRKQGFIFGTALTDTLLTSLTPLSRINVIWRGVRYDCLTDGVSWADTQTEMAIGMRLIVIGTALEADPPTTIYPVAIASALIEATSTQASITTCVISAEQFLGGTSTQDSVTQCFISEGVIIEGVSTQDSNSTCTISAIITAISTQDATTAIRITSSIGEIISTQDTASECTISPVPFRAISTQDTASECTISLDADPDVAAYKATYIAEGSTLATGEESALTTFVEALKTAGIWSKLGYMWVCPVSPSNVTSGSIYLKPYGSTDRFSLVGFVLGDFSINGLIGNGTSKYADTNIATNALCSATAVTWGAYCNSTSTTGNEVAMAISVSASATWILSVNSTSNGGAYWEAGVRADTLVTETVANTNGLTVGTLSSTDSTIYKNKTLLDTRSVSSNATTVPSLNIFAWARNVNGVSIDSHTPYRYSLMFAYDKATMNTTERDALYDAYAAYCSAIGRSL